MQVKPTILTARTIQNENWINNTTSIYELYPFAEAVRIPAFIRRKLESLSRYFNKSDIIIGTKLFIHRNKFNVIISNSGEQAIIYSLLSLLARHRQKIHILNEIYLQEPIGFKQRIRPLVYKLFLKNIDYIRASSLKEIDNFSGLLGIDKKRFWFLPYPTPVMNPEISNAEEDYILSAGKQFRDYPTLIKAIRGTRCRLVIVSDFNSMKNVETCEEVTVIYNISKRKYLDLLLRSKFVVVPLSNDFCSCGQIAILEGMSYGKPVITAKVVGTVDYIKDGESGLFYEKGDSKDLKEKILLILENRELREKLAREALIAVNTTFNQELFVKSYLQFIYEKWLLLIEQQKAS